MVSNQARLHDQDKPERQKEKWGHGQFLTLAMNQALGEPDLRAFDPDQGMRSSKG